MYSDPKLDTIGLNACPQDIVFRSFLLETWGVRLMTLRLLIKGLLSIAVVLTAFDVAKATVLDDVNATLASGEIYFDLTSTNTPESAISWGFPDTSDSSSTVNENVADEKGNDANELDMTISGLAANTGYSIDVVIFGKDPAGSETYDVAGGFTSGSLTNYLWTDGTQITGTDQGLWRIPIGSVSTNSIGDLHVFLGTGISFDGGLNRSEIDGVIYSAIPEPASAVLVLLGACGLALCRKRN